MKRGRILVWGAGGHGQVVADVAEACGWEVAGFIATEPGIAERGGKSVKVHADQAVRGTLAAGGPLPDGALALALGIGDNAARLGVADGVPAELLPVLIHPSAVISPSALFGAGTVALPQVVVNARAVIGRGVILNTTAVVEHDCRVDDGVHLSPGALLGGGVIVERLAWIGTGGVVIPRKVVGAGAMLGAGSTAHKDIPAGSTFVGNPARAVPGRGAE
jgi:sugar O-acyltransferase (sialic acid O-acetyltransferase NeuD family)